MIDLFLEKARAQLLSDADIETACRQLSLTRNDLFDAVSRKIVEGYSQGELGFDACDLVMNRLFYKLMRLRAPVPAYTYSVFLAFDDGEYIHPGDPEDFSPQDLYTKPAIARLLGDKE